MTMLSDTDIIKEIGQNILIYPFKPDSLKGSSYNLTASNKAWSIKTKKSLYDPASKNIKIPPNDTALILTKEVIWVSRKIAGTYHSKVGIVSQGIGHIGTTLDPGFIGVSLVALHNLSDKDVEISEGNTFVTLVFEYLNSKMTMTENHNNLSGRLDILRKNGIQVSNELEREHEQKYMTEYKALREKVIQQSSYREVKRKSKKLYEYLIKDNISWVITLFSAIILFAPNFVNQNDENWKNLQEIFKTIFTVSVTISINDLYKRSSGKV